jgi:peptidylprolyl isomerase
MSEDDKPRGEPAVKAKLPSAREIARTDFTPHGIGGKSRTKPSAMTAAKAKQRRVVLLISALVAVLAVASVVTYIATRPEPAVKVTGAFGKEPKVVIPKDLKSPVKTKTTVAIPGKGAKIGNGDYAFIDAATYLRSGKTSKRLDSSYSQGKPAPVQVGSQQLLAGLNKGLAGQQVGSRLVIEVPPADGLGAQGNPQAGIKGTDQLVFIVDVVSAYNKNAMASGTEQKVDDPKLPKVTAGEVGKVPTDLKMPKSDPPGKLVTKTLIQGGGAPLAKGQLVVAQYKGQLWRDGKVFDSSWKNGQLFTFELGGQGAIKGFTDGLTGQKVGSRVMLVIPPKDGYGKQGNGTIKGTDTMVFVVDIVGAQ